ncbi:hypothetical protein QFZ23_002282 [Arthrobacter globiformis]|nr:hypothetical protein [Arthrobacter globiformis]
MSCRLSGPVLWAEAAEEQVSTCNHQEEGDGSDGRELRVNSRDDQGEAG